ncbi:hypothetical protein DPEC_G00106250 [Dallia pectoralis]|uniref:Uncharacterized protein n=1 Tax=Dallia pectoralis TaxID=75939 RepID=A0ACC2GXW4_DALPE|nr:hypothetical protein DPEC_G00106250 [Dallia pectoralis]
MSGQERGLGGASVCAFIRRGCKCLSTQMRSGERRASASLLSCSFPELVKSSEVLTWPGCSCGFSAYLLCQLSEEQFLTTSTSAGHLSLREPYLAANPAYICQQKDNNNYFATLYDRTRRIPLYSAYKMDLTGETKRTGVIKFYEPQLIHRQLDKKQMTIIETTSDCGHHNKDNSEATMTFTNVAPQNKKMNNNVWSVYEKTLRAAYVKGATAANNVKCDNLYVVTGVIPGNTWQFGRVNVPSYYWSAHCCTKVNTNEELPVLSGGALCPNTENGKIEEFKNVKDLEQRLKLELKLSNQINIFAECVPKEARRNSFP